MLQITMSLNQIRSFGPCAPRYATLLRALNKTAPDDEQIPLAFILQSNGIKDAIWCMRCNWFEHKTVYMQFVNNCVTRAKKYAAADAAAEADAYAANYAADAANYAAYAANYAAAYAADAAAYAADAAYAEADADAADAERQNQYNDLMALLTA